MKAAIISTVLIFLFFFQSFLSVASEITDMDTYVATTAAEVSKHIKENDRLIEIDAGATGTYFVDQRLALDGITTVDTAKAGLYNRSLYQKYNGDVIILLHIIYPEGAGGKQDVIDSTLLFSQRISTQSDPQHNKTIIHVWSVINRIADKLYTFTHVIAGTNSNNDLIDQVTASVQQAMSCGVLTCSLDELSGIGEVSEIASNVKLSFTDEGLISSELTPAATTNLPVTYLTPSCQYIQFTTVISDQRYRGIYLVAFTYQGKQYNYCNNVITQKEGIKETIVGEKRTSTTSFLPFKTMNELPPAQATGFKKVICENGDYFVSIADSWYFKNFSIKPCNQVNSFKGGDGTIELTSTACQTYVDNCNSAISSNGVAGGSSNLVNYSQDATGVSMLTDNEYNSILGKVNGLNTAFSISIKTYILSKQNLDYANHLKEATADPSPNKIILEITGNKKTHTIRLQHKFEIPNWLKPSTSLVNDDGCISNYINEALDKLHENALYQTSILSDKIIAEYSVAFYRSIFGSLYCLTSENAVTGKSAAIKFMAGATHELIATVDIVEMVAGLMQVSKSIASAVIDSEKSYLLDLMQTHLDIANGTPISIEVLIQRLMPPKARLAINGIKSVITISSNFVKFYFTNCESTEEFGSNMCPYRYGQVAIMVIPIALTAGQWAWVKGGQLVSRLRVFNNLSRTEEVVNVLADAERIAGTTINEASGIITITEGEVITTIEKVDNTVVIKKNGVEGVQVAGTTGLLSKLASHPNISNLVSRLDDVADASLISKLDDIANNNPAKLAQLDDLYNPNKFQMTAGANRIPVNSPAPFQATINGKTVNYNSQGFPDFKPHSAGTGFEFKSNSLTGTGSATSGDFLAANNWASSNPALAGKFRVKPGSQRCEVKFGDDWIECTWHHYQDGRTMFPVPSTIHSTFKHTGGKAIIERGLQDIFQ